MLLVSFFCTTHQQHLWNTEIHTWLWALAPHYCKQQTRTRLNNKAADPELRDLCSRVSQQDTTYSNLPPPQGMEASHGVSASPGMLCYLMVLSSFSLFEGMNMIRLWRQSSKLGLRNLKYVISQYDMCLHTSHPWATNWMCAYPS